MMLRTGEITKVKSEPRFAFKKWWVDVEVITHSNETISTVITAETKLDLFQSYSVGSTISFSV